MTKITQSQRDLLNLINRSHDIGDGWRQSSDILWPHIKSVLPNELVEIREDEKQLRLTPEGLTVYKYL